jgi:hypothetical protein
MQSAVDYSGVYIEMQNRLREVYRLTNEREMKEALRESAEVLDLAKELYFLLGKQQ